MCAAAQRPRVVLAELLLETLVGLPVRFQCRLEVAQRTQVGAQPVGRDERVRMIGPEHRALPFQHVGVQIAGIGEAALGTQQVGDVELQVQGLLVVRAELMRPQVLQPPGQDQADSNSPCFHW